MVRLRTTTSHYCSAPTVSRPTEAIERRPDIETRPPQNSWAAFLLNDFASISCPYLYHTVGHAQYSKNRVPIVSLFLSAYLVQNLYKSMAHVQESELAADAVFRR